MNQRTGLILLVSVAVLLGLVLYLNANPELTTKPTPTVNAAEGNQSLLWTIDMLQVKSFKVVDLTKSLTFEAALDEAGKWQMTQPVAAEAESTKISVALNAFTGLYITREFTEPVSLVDFGLDKPGYAFEIFLKDGTIYRAQVGQKTVTGFEYYVLPEGRTNPVLLGSGSLDMFLAFPSQPPLITPTAPVGPALSPTVSPAATEATPTP